MTVSHACGHLRLAGIYQLQHPVRNRTVACIQRHQKCQVAHLDAHTSIHTDRLTPLHARVVQHDARPQTAHGVQWQLPALHAQVGIQRQPGIGRFGHAHLYTHVLIDLQLRGQFAQQCGRCARTVVQRHAPVQLAAGLQCTAYPTQLAICTPLAGTRCVRMPALRIAGDIQRCGVAMQGNQRIG